MKASEIAIFTISVEIKILWGSTILTPASKEMNLGFLFIYLFSFVLFFLCRSLPTLCQITPALNPGNTNFIFIGVTIRSLVFISEYFAGKFPTLYVFIKYYWVTLFSSAENTFTFPNCFNYCLAKDKTWSGIKNIWVQLSNTWEKWSYSISYVGKGHVFLAS